MKEITEIYIVRRNSDGKIMRSNNKNVFISLAHIKSSGLIYAIREGRYSIYKYDLTRLPAIEMELNEVR